MRTILDRYIFSELLPPFLVSLGALCFIMLTKELLRLVELLVSQGVGFLAVLKVFVYLMPSFLVLTLPIAGIIASITTFSRLSYERELIAMKAAGLSLIRLSRPVLVFSCLVFGLTLVLSQWGQPWSNISLKKLALSVMRDQLTLSLEKGVFNQPVSDMVVYVGDTNVDGKPTRGIFISDERNPAEGYVIVAANYSLVNELEKNRVVLHLFNGTVHTKPRTADQYQQVSFLTYHLPVPIDPNLYGPVQERPSRETLLKRLNETNWQDTGALRRLMEAYKDIAFPTAALLFGMLGVPVGILTKKSGRVGGFGVGVFLVILYYLLNVLGDFFVVTRVFPPFAGAWVPNAVVLILTIWLFRRMGRQ